MLIPCLDIVNGEVVRLKQGKNVTLKAGDPFQYIEKYGVLPNVSIVDIDAAKGESNNRDLIKQIISKFHLNHPGCKVRVGGGIRSIEVAKEYLNAGAQYVMIGTAANPDFLSKLPKDRVIVCVDSFKLNVVTEGWQKNTGKNVFSIIKELLPHADNFLLTLAEKDGTMEGLDIELVKKFGELLNDKNVSIAGGINNYDSIRELDLLNFDCHVGMAIYQKFLSLEESVWCCVKEEKDTKGVPAVIKDITLNRVLGVVFLKKDTFSKAFSCLKLNTVENEWIPKNHKIIRIDLDCDRDALRVLIKSWDYEENEKIGSFSNYPFSEAKLFFDLKEKLKNTENYSYTNVMIDNPSVLKAKIMEEAYELITADNEIEICREASDLLYFAYVYCTQNKVHQNNILRELAMRSLKVKTIKKKLKNEKLKFAIPKGRIQNNCIKILKEMGINIKIQSARHYIPEVTCTNEKLKDFVDRTDFFITDCKNIVLLLQSKRINYGFCGRDLLVDRTWEEYSNINNILDTKKNRVKISMSSYKGKSLEYWKKEGEKREIIVFSEYPKLTIQYIKKEKLKNFMCYTSNGATEGLIGIADIIVCVVETGNTLEKNGLEEIAVILESSTCFLSSKEEKEFEKDEIEMLKSLEMVTK